MYSFSHVVGEAATTGRGFYFPTAMVLGDGGVVYVVNRSTEQNFTPHISKLTIGAPGEEELLCDFGEYGEKDGQFLWPTSIALDREKTSTSLMSGFSASPSLIGMAISWTNGAHRERAKANSTTPPVWSLMRMITFTSSIA